MKKALWLLAVLPCLAHADLYRWVDPDTGSVKLSSAPPSDPRINAEIVPYKAPAAAPKAPAASPKPPAASPTPAIPPSSPPGAR